MPLSIWGQNSYRVLSKCTAVDSNWISFVCILGNNAKRLYSNTTQKFIVPPSLNSLIKDFNFISHVLEPWVNKQPNHHALWLTDGISSKKVNYQDLFTSTQHLSSALSHQGCPPKCSIVVLPKISPWWTINLAGCWLGQAISPGTPLLTERDIAYRIEACNADAIFCSTTLMEKVDSFTQHLKWRIVTEETKDQELRNLRSGWISFHELLKEGSSCKVPPYNKDVDAVVQLFFTSGTTGKPKMVPHTQASYGLGHFAMARDFLNLQPDDVFWNLSDLGWAKSAYSSLYAPLIAGCTAYVHQMPRFDPKLFLKTLSEDAVTVTCCAPTAIRAVAQEDLENFKPKALRKCATAGEPLNPEVNEIWFKHTGLKIFEAYGQTETTLSVMSTENAMKFGSMGKPLTHYGYNLKIVDDDLTELKPYEVGQIAIYLKDGWPAGLLRDYYKNKKQSEKSFVGDYFLSGDRAYMDDEGFIWFVGRDDDIIISAGYRIGPFEVESCLVEHPAVMESAVVASPDQYRGMVVKAFIILNEDYKIKAQQDPSKLIAELQNYCKRNIAPYKYPRKIEFVDSLPKTVSGKIQRVILKKQEAGKANAPHDKE